MWNALEYKSSLFKRFFFSTSLVSKISQMDFLHQFWHYKNGSKKEQCAETTLRWSIFTPFISLPFFTNFLQVRGGERESGTVTALFLKQLKLSLFFFTVLNAFYPVKLRQKNWWTPPLEAWLKKEKNIFFFSFPTTELGRKSLCISHGWGSLHCRSVLSYTEVTSWPLKGDNPSLQKNF